LGNIRVLGDELINRIAAGEVVERPASVVKELVENAIDAGARSVDVLLEAGGKRSIRVADDGSGMDRDDALLALERHATSKLARPADLDSIRTLGFRGEALASIAAVSQFTLGSSDRDGHGTEVRVRGGRIESVRDVALARGTTVQVERLFFNVPARRKFLRSDVTELSHVVRWITRYALAHPEVRFRLEQGGRSFVRTSVAADRARRVAELFGEELVAKLLPFDSGVDDLRVEGLAGRPAEALPRRDGQYLFVNGRAVQDRLLAHAVQAAYGNTMPRGRYPLLFLFVEIDPTQVDVNVHPQKVEVRFREPRAVHDHVSRAVSAALNQAGVVSSHADLRPATAGAGEAVAIRVGEAAARYLEAHDVPRSSWPSRAPGEGGTGRGLTPGAGPPAVQPDLLDTADGAGPEHPAIPLAQFLDSYIVAQDRQGLVIVDQHAAHERVLFERYLADARENRVEVQRTLFPVIVELAPHERVLLEDELDEFRRLGFLIEPFGGNSVRVEGVPALAGGVDPAALLRELVGEASAARAAAADVDHLRRRLVTSAACQAAIKVHYPLTKPTMQGLLDDLYVTDNPSTCPHGRPALFRLTREEIERTFRRR